VNFLRYYTSKTQVFLGWDRRSSHMLFSVDSKLVTDILGQPIAPTFKGQAIKKNWTAWTLDRLILEDGADRLSRNVGNYQSALRNIPEERRSHISGGGSLKARTNPSAMLHRLEWWVVTFRWIVVPSSYRSNSPKSCWTSFPEDEGITVHRNVGNYQHGAISPVELNLEQPCWENPKGTITSIT